MDDFALKKMPDGIDYVINTSKKPETDTFIISDEGEDDTENFTDPFFEAELASFG